MYRSQRSINTGTAGLRVGTAVAGTDLGSTLASGMPSEVPAGLTSTFSRYAVAVLSVAAAVLAAKASVALLNAEPFVSLFLCAIMFSAWFGGLGPGLLSTAVAALAFDYYLMSPIHSFTLNLQELPRLGLF